MTILEERLSIKNLFNIVLNFMCRTFGQAILSFISMNEPIIDGKNTADYFITCNQGIQFSAEAVEAAHIMIAISVFRNLFEQGLLTETEYREFALDGQKRWRKILDGGNMPTSRVERSLC